MTKESKLRKQVNLRLKWFLGLTWLAVIDTIYLTYMHFKPSASTLCKINDYLDCDIVNKSVYSELFDVPVSIWGMLTYLLLFFLGLGIYKGFRFTRWNKALRHVNILWFMFAVTAFGVLFAGYLSYVEVFILHALCIFCVAQQIIIIILLFLLLGILSKIDEGKKKNPDVCEFC
jgi:uncharacterized membrane protein